MQAGVGWRNDEIAGFRDAPLDTSLGLRKRQGGQLRRDVGRVASRLQSSAKGGSGHPGTHTLTDEVPVGEGCTRALPHAGPARFVATGNHTQSLPQVVLLQLQGRQPQSEQRMPHTR